MQCHAMPCLAVPLFAWRHPDCLTMPGVALHCRAWFSWQVVHQSCHVMVYLDLVKATGQSHQTGCIICSV